MLNIEQFVYTTASSKNKQGYQIVAKSNGVTNDIISKIDPYFHPIGILPSKFIESKSLLVFKDEKKIIFSKIRNIGIGYDGRDNTLYNHSLILDIDEFSQIDNDTRILEAFYFEDYDISGELPQLKINPQKSVLSFNMMSQFEKSLPTVMHLIFNQNKIALVQTRDNQTIQQILNLLPSSMRLISFSTMIMNIEKQPYYKIISLPSTINIQSFNTVNLASPQPRQISTNKLFEEGMTYFIELITSRNIDQIEDFFKKFENLSGNNYKDKLILLAFFEKFINEKNIKIQYDYARVMLDYLKQFEPSSGLELFNKIKDHLPPEIIIKSIPEFDIFAILNDHNDIELNKNNIEKMLNQLNDGRIDSRLKLLSELAITRKKEFIKKSTELLIDARYAYYRTDIYRIFVDLDFLHQCIFDIFESPDDVLTLYHKRYIFEIIFSIAIEINPRLITSLLSYELYDITDKHDAIDFKDLMRRLIDSEKFIILDFELIFDICNMVFSKIQNSTTKKQTSGINEITNSTMNELVKITKMFKLYIDNVIKNKNFNSKQKYKLVRLRTQMQKFIDKNYKLGFFNFFEI